MVEQGGLTVIAPVKPRDVANLRRLLQRIGNDVEDNPIVPFSKLTTIHFARWVILSEREDAYGNPIPPSLAFASNFDLPLDAHLEELVRVVGSGLDQIYDHCVDYPDADDRTADGRLAYLRDHIVENAAFYVGASGRSVQQIHQEAELRDAIENLLDRQDGADVWAGKDPEDVRRAIQEFVREESSLSWAQSPAPSRSLAWQLRRYGWLAGFLLGLASLSLGLPTLVGWAIRAGLGLPGWVWPAISVPMAVAPPLAFVLLLRINEMRDAQRATEDDYGHIKELVEGEDRVGQNPMTWVLNIKPGWFRQFTLRLVMFGTGLVIRYVYTRGTLLGVPSVHFARFTIIDQSRRLLFLSNFDGSWENYTGDFVDRAAWGLTAIWSNTVGFSDTRWLIFGGAGSERHFKGTHRDNEPPTDVFYSAHKRLSLQNVYQNSKIRAGLGGELNPPAVREWLRLL